MMAEKFETALQQLEEIVEKLQSDELPLDQSIALFEKGTKLSQICSQKLNEAEEKIDALLTALSKVEKNEEVQE
ncbi:MAG: exodeoxyribonuclease VII small subunit [Bdellovibrionota bacterium]